MAPAIDSAFNTPYLDVRPSTSMCPSGNCTWPLYSTLGICHECQDISYLMRYICQNNTKLTQNAADPCGFRVNDTLITGLAGLPGFRRAYSLVTEIVDTLNTPNEFRAHFNSTVFQNSTLPIVDFYVGYTPGGPSAVMKNETPVLVECQFTWCAKTLRAQFVNGLLHESVVSSVNIEPDSKDEWGHAPVAARLRPNATFTIVNGTTQKLRNWISNNLPPLLMQNPEFDFEPFSGLWAFHQIAPCDINGWLANVTTAMTNNLKSRGTGSVQVEGSAWAEQRFVEVRWAWISLPAVSLVGSLILIAATVLKGRGSDVSTWKSSAIATLLHGLTEETRGTFDPDISSSETEALSTKLRVKLSPGKDNVRLLPV